MSSATSASSESPASSSSGEQGAGNRRQAARNRNSCCLGLAYFSRSLREGGKAPKCFGMSDMKEGAVDLGRLAQVSDSAGEFKARAQVSLHLYFPVPSSLARLSELFPSLQYYCIGYSLYPDGAPHVLPYCEGIEVGCTEVVLLA